ncbi:Hit-like protein involved in cell-cycle regulation [Babesia microti strain RI]|uniref:Hit-like protein involved in cell-cycle regulation n=1 Tax=Babesia microti (strain RI) TaxID=1133968 RepID=A0A1R4AAI3_BABMR|nr:Hit-like protein involved in cell-cycle regulation [Babesia microti strain RI]SJK86019.1 Hit-like protein involved in cell-cycle regulation [Babesia microti strain RI]|eukprot:XP_021338217.1 Hit-like protein involved in cell-cycle regulation [Babesia microti strain RI]
MPKYIHRMSTSNLKSCYIDPDEKLIEERGIDSTNTSIFGKILDGSIPCNKVYEDDKVLAFHDISPQAPVHILIIPKIRDGLTRLEKAEERHREILGHMMCKAAEIARNEQLGDFRLVVNNGPRAFQSVYHLHIHILAKRDFTWPPG